MSSDKIGHHLSEILILIFKILFSRDKAIPGMVFPYARYGRFNSERLLCRLVTNVIETIIGIAQCRRRAQVDDRRVARVFSGDGGADVLGALRMKGESIGRAAIAYKGFIAYRLFARDVTAVNFAVKFTLIMTVAGILFQQLAGQFFKKN